MSSYLYQCFIDFASREIRLFEQEERGVLTYSEGTLYIEAPTNNQIESFMSQTVKKYAQKSIPVTQQKWDELMSNDSMKYNSLVLPFQTHTTQVKILPVVFDGSPQLLLLGVNDAVESAYECLWNILVKDLKVDK